MDTNYCRLCREILAEVLVYKNGARRRTRVRQCPNHCDQRCPQCDVRISISISKEDELILDCNDCNWSGTILYYPLVKKIVRKERERFRLIEKQTRWRMIQVAVDAPCHQCGEKLKEKSRILETSDLGNRRVQRRLQREIICSNKECNWIGQSEIVIQWMTPRGNWSLSEFIPAVQTNCPACTQVIRDGTKCGCN